MKIKSIKLKNKIKEVEFSPKELYMFKKKIKARNSQCRVSTNDLHSKNSLLSKEGVSGYLDGFFGLLFFQIPFIVTEIFLRRLYFLFVSVATIFFIYLVVYLSGRLRNIDRVRAI